jgi:hypothetical protein
MASITVFLKCIYQSWRTWVRFVREKAMPDFGNTALYENLVGLPCFMGFLNLRRSGYTHRDERGWLDEDSWLAVCKVYRAEINDVAKRVKLWAWRKRGNNDEAGCSLAPQFLAGSANQFFKARSRALAPC